jgi:hypothetical protein
VSRQWDAEHRPLQRARRAAIKALKAYQAAGGSLYGKKFDQLTMFDGAAVADFKDLTTELLTAVIALTHPDRHPPERKAEALRVTQELTALKPFVFPEPEPSKPNDTYSNQTVIDLDKPSPPYPCEDCCDADPNFYCDQCKAKWDKEEAGRREQREQKRKNKNARQRERYSALKKRRVRAKPTVCASCNETFKPKRADAKFCSAACRQRAYVKRDGKGSNSKPLGSAEIERAIADALASNPDNAFTTDDLCERAYPELGRAERKYRVAVIPIAKQVCQRLGENWDWWRSESPGRTLVFWNRISVTSYAMARLKSEPWLYGYKSDEELKALIAPGGREHRYVIEGGAWWKHCQKDIAKSSRRMTAKQNDARDDLTSRHGTAA